jgi:sulfatase maturation enzyme AslB (radical SAM superfamily)
MANQQIFCNTPWYEAHIYWDGSLGICCQESRKLYSDDQKYNIKNMTLREWFNSEPVKDFRKKLLSDTPTDICSWCANEENVGGYSRRHRSNQKSVIFTRTAFESSFEQSPGYGHFKYSELNQGLTNTLPIDLHIDLGNYCNLACKMCWSGASSSIAVQQVKWGVNKDQQYLGNDWTKDRETWSRVLNELLNIPKLRNIHFMGGETLLTPRFEEFVDFMAQHRRFDICFSFVTNGTVFNESLITKLKKFSRVGIEVSIETVTPHNNYVRQGTDTELVLGNIEKYKKHCDGSSVTLTIRPTISALTVGYYHTLLEYCLENQFLIKSLLVTDPNWLNINVLPSDIRSSYLGKYHKLLEKLSDINTDSDYNESDPNNYLRNIKIQCLQTIRSLKSKQSIDSNQQLKVMIEHCRKWDNVYKLNAFELYPELRELFRQNGY